MSDDAAIRRSLSEEIGYWLESAARTLEKRYGNGVPLAKQDALLAHYLYGLTAVVHAGDEPAVVVRRPLDIIGDFPVQVGKQGLGPQV